MPKFEKVTLATICEGAASEVFQKTMEEVLANINEPNTDPEKARRITLTFGFKPTQDRSVAEVTFACEAKIVPVRAFKSTIMMARENGSLNAYASTARQEPLFAAEADSLPVSVPPIADPSAQHYNDNLLRP